MWRRCLFTAKKNTAAAYCRYFSSFLSAEFADSNASEKIELGQSNALYCSMIHWLGGWMDGWMDGWIANGFIYNHNNHISYGDVISWLQYDIYVDVFF